jgi:hypothetical protein
MPSTEVDGGPPKCWRRSPICWRWHWRRRAPKGEVDISIPAFGFKSHIITDRAHGFIRAFKVTDAARPDGAQLKDIARTDILATGVWADSAYRSKANEA